MELAKNFPELSDGQLRMLERYVQERETDAVTRDRIAKQR
jgi:hypothetical protein